MEVSREHWKIITDAAYAKARPEHTLGDIPHLLAEARQGRWLAELLFDKVRREAAALGLPEGVDEARAWLGSMERKLAEWIDEWAEAAYLREDADACEAESRRLMEAAGLS